MTLKQTEQEIIRNIPVHLFSINKKEYKTPLLSMAKLDEWLVLVDELTELESKVNDAKLSMDKAAIREAKRAYNEKMEDLIIAYNPEAFPEDMVKGKLSAPQIVEAFSLLLEMSDPFDLMQLQTTAKVMDALKGMPPGLVEKALAKVQDTQ